MLMDERADHHSATPSRPTRARQPARQAAVPLQLLWEAG